jgi:5-methylcytosine-specific restriction endonuclease McrA
MSRWRKLYDQHGFFQCPYCLKQFPLSNASIEHEPPKSRQKELGGSKILLACKKCNAEKGALTAEEYAEWKRLEFIRNGGSSR